jgi:hypothetical protein
VTHNCGFYICSLDLLDVSVIITVDYISSHIEPISHCVSSGSRTGLYLLVFYYSVRLTASQPRLKSPGPNSKHSTLIQFSQLLYSADCLQDNPSARIYKKHVI